jgi:hypothetical protein
MDKKGAIPGPGAAEETLFSRVVKVADVALKLTPAVATGLAAWIAYEYQARSAGMNLLNQREQAETQLRASMFNNLIGPIAGPIKDRPIGADQQRVLVELLMLNFHEHVELKPLLLSADKRLATELKPEEAADAARHSLRSAVRRVLDRQLAVLQKDCATAWAAVSSNALDQTRNCWEQPDTVSFCESVPATAAARQPELTVGGTPCLVIAPTSGHTAAVNSPDGKYRLSIAIESADWKEQTFKVNVLWARNSIPVNATPFELTRYDLPFTENTILDRDHRFALVVKDVNKNAECTTPAAGAGPKDLKCRILNLWVVWFPPRYILAHERPVNFQEIRRILELDAAPR